jgi:hypothetical protein
MLRHSPREGIHEAAVQYLQGQAREYFEKMMAGVEHSDPGESR